MIEGFEARYLLADKGYDSDAIVAQAREQGMEPVIPPRKNRKYQREYDKALYRLRHLVENAFLHLKRPACRQAGGGGLPLVMPQTRASFLAAVHIRWIVLRAENL